MLSLDYYGLSLMFLSIITGVSCEELSPVKNEESSLEDSTVTLSYTYSKQGGADYVFWYRQYPGKPPEFLISHSGTGQLLSDSVSRLSFNVSEDKTKIYLQISSAAVTDSAVYYCAVRPAGGSSQYKIIFGSGTRLNIEPKEEYEPDYFRLESSGTFACLATGFTRQDGASSHSYYTDYFNKTEAIRIGGDKVYNQVALLESGNDGTECEKDGGSEDSSCEDSIKPDPTVNFVSVTVLCLRVIFIKTIVFNVLMTFRLWISQ